MRKAKVFFDKTVIAGILSENPQEKSYVFEYDKSYQGPPVSLSMPLSQKIYRFEAFPPFFEGLLPEGPQLEALLRLAKLDREDYFGQLLTVGKDLVGAFSVEEDLS